MIKLKCKVCGGELVLQGEGLARCKECENLMMMPLIDSDVRTDMFNRGNYYRMNYEYDRAAQAFEQIIARDPEDVEARFCLALCHHGIEYVKDPRSSVYLPTCHRSNSYSILEDVDYLAALKYAPYQNRYILEQQAEAIDQIWKKIEAIARYEEPYDVFICYKETTVDRKNSMMRMGAQERTIDSVIAQHLYEELTQRGVRVFFSRISLENKLGSEYEPYIYSALQSSKVMLLVSTCRAHIESVWVKNEWMRFLNLQMQDRKREIIPVLKGMDKYDLPDELVECIPRNLDETGMEQDLIRGVLKITGHTEGSIGMIRNRELETLAMEFLQQRNWKDADMAAEQMLNLNPDNESAYKIHFLAEMKEGNLQNCRESEKKLEEMPSFLRMQKHASGNLRLEIDELLHYRATKKAYDTANTALQEKRYEEAYRDFLLAEDYQDAIVRASQCKEKAQLQRRKRELSENLKRYQTAIKNAEEEVELEWVKKYPEVEARAVTLKKSAKEYKRPCILLPFLAVILLGVVVAFSIMNEGVMLAEYYNDDIAIIEILFILALSVSLGRSFFRNKRIIFQYLAYSGICYILCGSYIGIQQKLEKILLKQVGEIKALCISACVASMLPLIVSMTQFFIKRKLFTKNERLRREEEYYTKVKIPEIKKELLSNKLEKLRTEYEPLIGNENCIK